MVDKDMKEAKRITALAGMGVSMVALCLAAGGIVVYVSMEIAEISHNITLLVIVSYLSVVWGLAFLGAVLVLKSGFFAYGQFYDSKGSN